MYKSKRQKNKSFDWYGLSQRFSIRKYHFGAASVLLGTALILGAAQSTAKAEEATADNKTEAVTSTPKDGEGATSPTNVTLPATEATTGAPVLDKKELSEEEIAKLAAEASKKDDKTSETATSEKSEVADKEKATLVADSTDKKSEKAVDDKADKKDEKKAENPIAATKTILEQLTSEAEVLNTTAANYAEKKVEDKSSKEAIAAAVAAAKVEIAASKKVLNEKDVTAEQLNLQLQRISSAIEAVYTEMKRAGHIGKVEAVLADVTATVKLPERTKVRNTSSLTDEEVDGIIRQVRIANPNLTDADKISVLKNSGQANNAGEVTITYANGDTAKIASGDAVIGAGVARNVEGLKDAINWFEFSAASIVYPDGTEVGPARYLATPKQIQVDHPSGNGKVTANLNIVRDVKYADGTTGLTTDDKFLNSGITEFTVHEYYTGGFQNNNEAYEVLKEGMLLKVPTRVKGYNLTLRVEKLAPKQVATDPNNTETRGKNALNAAQGADKRFKPVKMILTTQDTTNSYLYKAGMKITDKNNRPALATITTNRDGANAGITFSASATFNGQPVPVNLVAADGEESGRGEVLQFETNGSNWKELMAINLTEKQQTAQEGYKLGGDVKATTEGELDFYAGYTRNNIGYKASEWVNKTQAVDDQGNLRYDSQGRPIMTETAYGTKFFGPTWNAMRQGNALGFGFSEGVSEFSMYVNSSGAQAGSIGFVVYDGGDAPQSFGTVQHVIGNINRTNERGEQVVATQPHFGDEPGDPDFRSTATDPSGAWVLDDLINTNGYKIIGMKEGNSVTNEAGETGTYKLVDVNGRKTPVILKADGSTVALKTGEILKIINPEDNFPVKGIFDVASQGVGIGTLPDEGKGQLLDPVVAVDYKLRQATDNEYVLDGIKVNPGENNEKAYARGWVDFNNNGKFDEDESSEVVEVTGKQTVSFKFKNTPQLLNTSIDSVGVRLRIALDRKEILSPTGLASSGEVEDFQTHVIHPPRGTENKTQNLQGKPQNLTLNTTDLFTATGKTEASKYSTWNEIDNTIAPKFVLTESAVASETETGNTVNITDATGTTVYNGKEVVVRDARGNVLGTAVKVTNPLNNKTEYLLSEYTEYDTAGNKVGVYRLNKDNNGLNKASSNGIYRTTIDFEPALPYVGTAKGVAIRAWDQNRISTGWNANEKTITESKKNITLADKDKILKNVNENVNGRYSMDSTYIPTVVDVRPVGEDTVTTDVQGKQQSATPKIPAYGTVEAQTGDKITDVKYTSDYVILDKTKKPTFAKTLENRKNSYDTDTTVNKTTTLTLEDGRIITYKTDTDKFAKDTRIAADSSVTVTGTGGVVVNNVRITSGNTIPVGAKPQSNHPAKSEVRVQLKDGSEQTIPAGGTIPGGATLLEPMVTKDNNTWDNVTYNTGDTIPQSSAGKIPILGAATSASQIVSKGNVVKVGDQYYSTNIIPAGTKIKAVLPFNEITLPKAIHLDPNTGVITEVPRSYDLDPTKTNDTKVTIKGEGVYELNQDTGKVTFTPEPGFVGTGTGVDLEQPDIDYNDKVTGDKVTERYGTDFGRAKYTPIVTPSTSASITRTIRYVYENDDDNPSSTASYTDNKEILAIDGEPVVIKQTLNYTRTYKIFEEDGVLEEATRSAVPVTDVNGKTYAVGEEIPAGTKFAQGKIIISEWKTLEGNAVMKQVISPTVKGYTANVITADFTAANAQGKMGHIHNNKQPVGLYTPVPDNTRDVGEYEPLVLEVTSDKTDDFDMYVVYKRDTQKANVVYIDLDEKGDKRVLEIQSGITTADLTAANKQPEAKTTYNVADLRGKSDTKIPYDTAATIKKYTDKGFELASDDYTNDENGNALANGRNFDEDSTNDQTFYVYLRHKKEQLSKNDVRTVTRHIEYKYADTAEVPADKRGQAVETTLAKKVTEVLTFERTRTIDMAATAKLYETQYNAYKAVAANNAVGSDAEVEARATLFKYVEDKAKEAGATAEAKAVISYGEWQAKPGQATNLTLSAAEENIKDSKFNDVVSPTVPGYLPDNAKVEATADINPESDPKEYTVTVTYSPGDQKAIVNFVEVDATNTDQVITPGLTTPVTLTGKSGTAFPTTASASVQAKIDELVKKGYELVPNGNGFVSTDSFDTNAAVDQTYTVKLRVKPITVTPNDPTPTPNTPIDPNNPTGPKWTPELIKELEDGRKEEVKRTINYVYADGTKAKDSVEETKEFKRSATINPVTGKITFGEWSAAQTFEEKQSPAIDNYTPNKASVEAKEVTATADDITETVIYSTSKVTVDPNPVDPNENPDPNKVVENDPKKRTLKELGLVEEVKHTIHYVYEDGTKADEDVVQTLTYTRTAKIDPVTGEISDYSTWTAKKGDDFTAVTSPAKEGYIVSKATSIAINDVPATADDTEETIIYRKLGSYIPVVPEGVTVPPGTDTTAKVYPKNPNDPTKPGTPTTTIPEIPGTTPVGPDGTPLTKNPNGGYNVPPVPTDPTQNTTITYVKDGSQVAVTHFIEVNSATDKTEKGAVAQSVVDTGDTGKAFTKGQSVTDTINALKAKGYTVVENRYPTNGTFDADSTTNQEYKVLVTVKPVTITPNTDVPNPEDPNTPADNPIQPGKPIDPTNPEGPKWTKDLIDKLRDARKEEVTRTITYKYSDVTSELKAEDAAKAGQQAADTVTNTVTFKRSVTIDPVTKEFTYGDWEATNGTTLAGKAVLPVVTGYVATGDVDSSKKDVENVTATDNDITENVVYKAVGKYVPVIPDGITPPANTNVDPKPYTNDPQDGSKVKDPDPTNPVVPGTTTPIVPQVPGTTPVGPDGKPLKPVDSSDLSKGYVPPTPTDPTKDTSIIYVKDGTQIAVTKFVDVDGNGLEPSVVDTGDTGKAFTKDADVTAAINKILARGYEKVANVNAGEKDYPSTDAEKVFDADAKTNQEFTVTFKPIVKEVPVDPATPGTKPQPGQPVDPSNPDGPKWPSSVKDLKNSDTVKRTIKYVYEDGTPVIDPATGAQKVVEQTAEFTRTANVNLVTGDITYGDWTPAKELAPVASPTATDIPAVANYIASVATVPAVTIAAEADDITETVVYRQAKPVTITPTDSVPNDDPSTPVDPNNPIQPGKPIDPNNPDGPKWTKDLIDKLRDARSETVTRTITYKYSTETSELKAEDAAKAGQNAADTVTNTVTFKRPVTIDPITKEFTYGDWEATNGTTLAGKADLPVVAGYVATGDVEASKKDVTDVKATDKDITENVVYKTVGKYVPVIPEGITPPANTNVDPKPYNNDPQDGSKVKDPNPTNPVVPGTTTPIVPQIPGTTPVGPDGKPLKPVDSNDLSKGYVPPTPTDPTKDTSIIYVKDGSQVAVVHFVDEKGNSVNESVVETGDTGKEISKSNVDKVKAALEAKGYEVVAPTDALYTTDKEGFYKEATRTFDAVSDKATGAADEKVPSQQYYVIVKGKELPVDPTKPLDPNNNPVDPTNPTPENPTTPRDPETPVTPKPEDKVPNDPKGRTYGELGLVEQVTRTINYVKNDGSKAAEPVKETLTFTRKAKINAVTGEVTYLDNDGNATTKEAAPWTPANNDSTFDKVTSPSVPDYTPTRAEVPAKENVTATDEDIVETVVYNPTKQTVDPNAPKDPSTPDVTPKPNDVVPNDPKGRTYKELGLIEEVTRTVHYVYEDGTKAAEDKVQTITFTRTAEIDTVTGAISNFGTWTLKDENNTFEPETTEAKDGYIASAAKSTEVTGVQATDKDTEETIIYRKLGSYVPVVPAGVTPPADFDKTPKPYPNATPEDPTRPGTPTTPTTTIPEIPGTTPVGPDGTPLTKNPNGGYDLPPVPTDPTQNTTITYVKDGSQVAVVHFVDEKGNSVNESVVETGDTGKEISKSNVDAVKAKLEAKGYEVVAPTDALYTTDKEGFYKEATRTFDAVSDKSTGAAGEKVPSQQYYVIVKAKDLPVDPTKPLDPNNNPVDPTNPTPENPTKPRDPETPVTPKPEDKVPNDPKGRTYGELGLVEQVTRTINYVKNDGSKAAEPVKETLTFTRKAKINAVTGEVTYLDNDGNATTKEAAPWTPVNNDTTFDKVTSPSVPDYTPTKAEVPAKENVTATDEDIVETVVYNPTKVTVTPNDPNVDPEKPLNPNDSNGLKYKDLKLTEEVKRTITYTYADDVADTSKRGTDAALKHETTVSFTRTATVNQATGEVTYGDWTAVNNDTTLEGKTELPVITGYVATGDVESSKNDVANVTATDKDIVEKVVYKDLGKYVPVVPDGTTPPSITDPKYPNNPTDPTKPGEPTTTIPPVDGLTPLDPSTGKPLEPKDPNDLSKGYKPPVPQDPSKDTNIVYVKDGSQVTVVHFVDEDGNAVHTSFVEAGDAGAKFTKAGEVTKVVEELKAAGYAVVPNKAGQAEYPGEAGVFDSVDDKGENGVSQVYYVTVAKTVPLTPTNPENPNEDPKNPKPGDPIDPNKPDGPKWTEDALNKLNNIKSVTRTITYVKDGTDEEVSTTEAPKVTNKVSFTRTAIVNPKDGSVVGYDTNGDGVADVSATDTTSGWAVAGTAKFAEVKSPVVKGYVVKPNQDTQGDLVEADGSKVKASATDLTVDSPNQDLKVRYVPVGTWTPKVPDGETPIDPIPYPNDPKDPGKVVDPNKPTDPNDPNKPSVPVVPHIPGTTPKDPNGNPLKPVDPEDPSKGYVPPTPKTPTENTVIEYVKNTQKATVKYVVAGTNTVLHTDELEGKSGEPINYSTATKLAELKELGYDLVTDGFTTATDKNYDKDTKVDQSFVVTVTPHVEPIKPFDPTNPNDPNKPKPDTPIDPNNPDGPKWTEELIKSLETTKHVTRTISYVDKDGNKVEYTDKDGNKSTADVTDKVTFTREAKINLVTGAIEYGKWTPVNNDTTFDKVTSPVVPGYVLKDPAQKEVAETTGLTENSKDENIKVVYVPVGRLVPKVPDGVTPPTPTPYDNDPQDPGKVVPPSPTKPTDPQDPNSPKVPVIPYIPGTTPKVPQDPTKPVDPNTNPLVPLKPVDPKDPSKGYEVPPVPTDPGTDTPIVYENDKQKAITNFVDNNGKVVSDPVVDQGDSGSKFTKSGDVESKIKELVKKGYVVTSNDYPSADTDRVFDNDKDKDQIFNVKVTPLIVPTDPNSPDQPQVPTDPTKPVGPNNPLKPVTPSTPEPGKPVFPEDPNSPVWPETVKDMVTETTATRTITYVDRNGKEVAATHTETIKFKRTAKVNLVTGDITYGEWTVVGDDTILDGNKLPKVDGYIARGGDIESSQKDIKATAGVNITERVVYDKLGSWIPKLPEGQTQVPPTPYPNDPTDPTKPGTDRPRVPYVPGFIPVDPNGNPLKPVDPNDPTKGYEVPVVPADPTQDTPIKYIPVPKPNNGGGNNGGGGGNTPTPQPQPNLTPQPEPSPAPNPVPVTPETPEQPVVPVAPEQPAEPATPQYMDGQRELPNTGTEAHSSLAALGLLGALSGFGLIARKKRKDEE
ncbi:mucin-binding protein [Streptococcus mitis]|uniref:mucin-binding protein n=1 Tax=Streptococcus mitis TaxID=28037 RepID=UPI0039C17A6B